jgi:CheY-like chemotaxis protein
MKNIFLADDDVIDRELFEDALQQLTIPTHLTQSEDGVELMTTLDKTVPPPPHAIFLDLNMPRKNGYECLAEIRNTHKLKDIMVVIFSTTDCQSAIEKSYLLGANYFICKPRSFQLLKKAIETVLLMDQPSIGEKTSIDNFFLSLN